MTRIVLPLIALLALLIAPSAEAAKRTCRSGETVYKKQGVRVFVVLHIYDDGYSADNEYYACGPKTRKPVHLHGVPQAYGGLGVDGRSGDKVLFSTSTSGEGGGDYGTVGWFDVKTSETRSGELVGEVANDLLDIVVAKDGSVAVAVGVEDEHEIRIGYLKARKGKLRGEIALATAGERYEKRSLAFAGGDKTLTWRAGGQPRSVPVNGEAMTCTAGTTLAESDGARVFEVLQQRREQVAVLAACGRGEATPRELATDDVQTQSFWELRALKRAGSRAAFAAGDNGVGLLDGGQVTFARPKDVRFVEDVAVGATGPVVFAGAKMIARLDAKHWVRLASQGGTIESGSLTVGDRVTWKTTQGLSQSTALAGETTVDCTTGTTLHEKDGLRVFDVLLTGANDARLFACPPGASAPLQLLSAPRDTNWGVAELAREAGRIALYSLSETAGHRVFSLDADDVLTGVPSNAYGEIKDVALAADGRIALAYPKKITAFALAGPGALKPERTIAKPGDGVQAGSLAIDGDTAVWRNRAGAARSAIISSPGASAAAVKRDCRSGKTIYEQDGVRIFQSGDEWFACGPSSGRPTFLWQDSSVAGGLRVFGRNGDQVLLTGDFFGEGGGEDTVVGFFDARTLRARVGMLATTVAHDVLEIVVAPDGGIGFVNQYNSESGARVGYLAPGIDRELGLSMARGYVKGSLAFSRGALTWQLKSGARRSVPLSGEPVTCTSGETLVESDGARVFEVLPNRATGRGFQADVLAACPRGATTPRELAVTDLVDGAHWDPHAEERDGTRVAFVVGNRGVGAIEGGEVRFVTAPTTRVRDIALGDDVVFGGDGVLGRLTAVTGWERIATTTVVPATLVADGRRVTWRTDDGVMQEVTLTAETPIDCASGKTLLQRKGLRVFEVLRAGADKALLACPAGGTVPVPLLTPKGRPRWTVSELGRERGRAAILVHTKGAEAPQMIAFDQHTVHVGLLYALRRPAKIRDLELAPDGRVALATQRRGRWTISTWKGALDLGLDHTIAERRDGVRPGSLAFDGTDVVWRNRAGAKRRGVLR